MRLKQLLGTVLLAIGMTAVATASVSQLSGVLVKSHESAGVVTILADGAFTHTEYRPADNLMLVDLAGVSRVHADTAVHPVFAPGVKSYRVVGYRSANGAETTRIELSLVPGAKVAVNDIAGGLELHVTGARAVPPSKEQIAASADALTKAQGLSHIHNVSVTHGQQGLDIEVAGSGPLTGKTMRLTAPDRLVLDIPNSLLEGRPLDIAVNSNGVKAVRAARYQSDPPVTRVVVDLAASRDFDLIPNGNRLLLKLNDAASKPVAAPAAVVAKATPVVLSQPMIEATTPAIEEVGAPAQRLAAAKPAGKIVEASPSRADIAASRFAHDVPAVPSVNQPPYAASLAAKPAAVNAALEHQQMMTQAATPVAVGAVTNCTSGRYTGEPIGVNFQDMDLKVFFRIIQEVSGLNVVLDPAVKGTVSLYLNDVPWDQALSIVLNNNGLECQLQGNVLRIATLETMKNEAEARRAQQEAQALAVPKEHVTRYLSYGQSRDAALIVKKFLSARGDVVADARSNALIIEDIPSVMPKVDDVIRTLDRKTPIVEIEARVVASTRSFSRDIGTQLAVGFASGNGVLFGNPAVGNSPIITTGPVPPTTFPPPVGPVTIGPTVGNLVGTGGQIPLFSNLGVGQPTSGIGFSTSTANFRLDFILSAAEERGLLKVLSRPHIVTQNNIQAVVKQGVRIPVVTASQLGGPPTVVYIDAFLRLTVTPQITAENTIFLQLDVENTAPEITLVAGANPTLDTQQATTNVLVSDGATLVIGGVIQTRNNLTIDQVPFLGNIPLLGNLFKHTLVKTQTQELMFFITPKIIQG
jgi:type IV pilus assembly protein PilQ